MVQGKNTLNEKQSFHCRNWWHGPLLFLHQFTSFVLLLMLHQSGKLAIPHDRVFLLIQILHLVLFKSLQRQGEMRISRDNCVVFWLDREGNCRLSLLRIANLLFFRVKIKDNLWNKGSVRLYYIEFSTRLNQFECSKNMKTVFP